MSRIKAKSINRKKQHGVSMAIALFLIVIVALLAAGIFQFTSTGNIAMAQEVVSTRAFMAAESGAQAMSREIFPQIAALPPGAGNCPAASVNYSFTNAGLKGCTAVVSCSQFTVGLNNYYDISSTGQCNAGQVVQATRTIDVRLRSIN